MKFSCFQPVEIWLSRSNFSFTTHRVTGNGYNYNLYHGHHGSKIIFICGCVHRRNIFDVSAALKTLQSVRVFTNVTFTMWLVLNFCLSHMHKTQTQNWISWLYFSHINQWVNVDVSNWHITHRQEPEFIVRTSQENGLDDLARRREIQSVHHREARHFGDRDISHPGVSRSSNQVDGVNTHGVGGSTCSSPRLEASHQIPECCGDVRLVCRQKICSYCAQRENCAMETFDMVFGEYAIYHLRLIQE